MEKIVVEWEKGGHDWSFNGIYCVEYESLEKLYLDLDQAVLAARAEATKSGNFYPKFKPESIVVGGVEFEIDNIAMIYEEDGKVELDAEFSLLEDWFTQKLNDGLIAGAKPNV